MLLRSLAEEPRGAAGGDCANIEQPFAPGCSARFQRNRGDDDCGLREEIFEVCGGHDSLPTARGDAEVAGRLHVASPVAGSVVVRPSLENA